MFILRRITSDNVEINTCLNDDYVLIEKEKSPVEFEETLKTLDFENDKDWIADIYGFISYDEGSIMPLYIKSQYYVMASDGRTFDNITRK